MGIPPLINTDSSELYFTSHVLMCVDSHSWRSWSSCSMFDMYCFSEDQNERITRDPNTKVYWTIHIMHHNPKEMQDIGNTTVYGIICSTVSNKGSKCHHHHEKVVPFTGFLLETTAITGKVPEKVVFVLTMHFCSFSALFGLDVDLKQKRESKMPLLYVPYVPND